MKRAVTPDKLDMSIFLLQPSRPIFCTTKNEDGSDHVAPFSWIMPISFHPPKVAFALQNERGSKLSQSLVNIMREHEFAVNLPHMGQEEKLVEASFLQGRHACKFDRTGYTRQAAQEVKPVLIGECNAAIECRVFSLQDTLGDHTLILADIVGASYDDACYAEDFCPKLDAMQPLINLREFRFDDHQRHEFIDTGKGYMVDIYYEK